MLWWVRECAAFGLWLFILIKVLVYDVDILFVGILPPQANTFLKYKFFVILGVIALLWLTMGNRRFFSTVAYVLYYPIVVLFWQIPKLIFKNWVLLLVFAPAIHSLITNFRMNFILSVGALLSALIILLSNSPPYLIAAMTFLAFYLCRHCVKKIRMAFQPGSIFANIADIIRQFWEELQKTTLANQVQVEAKLDPTSDAYKQKTLEHLNHLYFLNSVLRGILLKLQLSGISGKLNVYFITSLLYAALLTIIVFGFEFLGLEKMQPGSFGGSGRIGFWELLGLSFNTLMTAGVSPLAPKSAVAQLLAQCELVFALFLLVILVFVILTIFRERFREDAERATRELTKGAELIEGHIFQHYKLSIEDAERMLIVTNGPTVNRLRRFRGLAIIEVRATNDLKPEQKSPTDGSETK